MKLLFWKKPNSFHKVRTNSGCVYYDLQVVNDKVMMRFTRSGMTPEMRRAAQEHFEKTYPTCEDCLKNMYICECKL